MGTRTAYWSRLGRKRVNRRSFLIGAGMATVGSAATLAGMRGRLARAGASGNGGHRANRNPSFRILLETPEPTPSPEPTATPTPDPYAHRRGGTLRLWRDDRGLRDSTQASTHVSNWDVISSTLTQPLTYQPSKNLFAMDGMIGYEQVDPLTLVWSIRPGMKFHNGDPVDSEAVAFSFGRLAKLYRGPRLRHARPAGRLRASSTASSRRTTLRSRSTGAGRTRTRSFTGHGPTTRS